MVAQILGWMDIYSSSQEMRGSQNGSFEKQIGSFLLHSKAKMRVEKFPFVCFTYHIVRVVEANFDGRGFDWRRASPYAE